jgi:hypothetical protein
MFHLSRTLLVISQVKRWREISTKYKAIFCSYVANILQICGYHVGGLLHKVEVSEWIKELILEMLSPSLSTVGK